VKRTFLVLLGIGLVALFIKELPDFRRYLRIERM
jgi:hypothetical protein